MDQKKQEEKKIEQEIEKGIGFFRSLRRSLFTFGAFSALLVIYLDWINGGNGSLAGKSFVFIMRLLPNDGNVILISLWAALLFIILGGMPIYYGEMRKPRRLVIAFVVVFFSLPLLRYYLCLKNSCGAEKTIFLTIMNALGVSLGILVATEVIMWLRKRYVLNKK